MKKQRICLLAFSNYKTLNYGGVLQAFSLKKVLEEHTCCEVENINFAPKNSYFSSKKKKIFSFVYQKTILPVIKNRKRARKTKCFYDNYLFSRNYVSTLESVKQYINSNFDKTIIGSDQVLNPYINNYCDIYTGNGLLTKNYYYAASFGTETIDKKWSDIFVRNSKNIKMMSFREQSGLSIAQRLGIDGRVDLDPTLLLTKEQWEKITANSFIKLPKHYIFCYIMPGNKNVVRKIKKAAKELHKKYKYKIIYSGQKDYMKIINPFKNRGDLGPLEWVYAIRMADIIVTNSFHGTAFAVNFNKPFLSFTNKTTAGGQSNFSSRIYDLLNKMDLLAFVDSKEKATNVSIEDYDYKTVNSRLNDLRNQSIKYLKEIEND